MIYSVAISFNRRSGPIPFCSPPSLPASRLGDDNYQKGPVFSVPSVICFEFTFSWALSGTLWQMASEIQLVVSWKLCQDSSVRPAVLRRLWMAVGSVHRQRESVAVIFADLTDCWMETDICFPRGIFFPQKSQRQLLNNMAVSGRGNN